MDTPELRASIEKEIRRVTDNGRFVVFAYAAAPGDNSAIRIGVTTRRSYGDVLLWLEHSYPDIVVHSGSRQDPSLLEKLATDLVSVKIEKASPDGFNTNEAGHWRCFGEALSRLMPRRWGHRGFALFDMGVALLER